jgi:hydrogenase maturation protein HypF
MNSEFPDTSKQRLRVSIRGAVQGVGFRPFVYRLATSLDLVGWVKNTAQGVFIEVEGIAAVLENFLLRLESEKPPRSFIQSLESSFLDSVGYTSFVILPSEDSSQTGSSPKNALVLPDISTCPECLNDVFDPANRRYLYPFTNCTNCGPRFSIIEALPYDRPNTSMRGFAMCSECLQEYEDPRDRRFHAQPNACPACGPHLELWDQDGRVLSRRHEALQQAAQLLRQGQVVAIKGLGGFHLMVDGRNQEAVSLLRQRKRREEKPLALMFDRLESLTEECDIGELEKRLLLSPESPIVLLRKSRPSHSRLAEGIAPHNPYLGAMLPYTPLHHLLMRELGFPVVATSGNLSDEPICIDQHEALRRLKGIADYYLVHDRPIARHLDDSIARVLLGREQVLRRARGYAPLPIHVKPSLPSILAVGAHLKNTVAMSLGQEIFLSQHIGDLETPQALEAFQAVIESFKKLYDYTPAQIVCDLHPDYISSRYAHKSRLPITTVQHHFAHVAACMAENQLEGDLLGISWDGTGYGLDETVWGGEFIKFQNGGFERMAWFRPFRLPGGGKAVKEPRRSALGLFYELWGDALFEKTELLPVKAFTAAELSLIQGMLQKGINAPVTSSVGRIFDAVASLLGLRQLARFEGQAAMELEFLLDDIQCEETYPLNYFAGQQESKSPETNPPLPAILTSSASAAARDVKLGSGIIVDWGPLVEALLTDVERHTAAPVMAAKFHNTMVHAIIEVAEACGLERVVLTGGCFQNRYLTERAVFCLRQRGFRPYWHQRIPPNDGGIALGQVFAAALVQSKGSKD